MLPLKDNNPTSRIPVITIVLIVANVAVFIYSHLLGFGDQKFLMRFAAIPINVVSLGDFLEMGPLRAIATVFTSQFLHGDLFHVAGNMLFLWIFGNNVEDRLGPAGFTIFYFLSGLIAFTAQALADPYSQIPMIGASGAVSGVMGAYLILYPRARVLTLIWIVFFVRLIWLPAYAILLYWVALQVLYQISTPSSMGGVAYLAHIGGFGAGLIFILLVRGLSRKIDRY